MDDHSPGPFFGMGVNILRSEVKAFGQFENPSPADDIDNVLVLKTDLPLQLLRHSAQFVKKPFPTHLREVEQQHPGINVQFIQPETDLRFVMNPINP